MAIFRRKVIFGGLKIIIIIGDFQYGLFKVGLIVMTPSIDDTFSFIAVGNRANRAFFGVSYTACAIQK